MSQLSWQRFFDAVMGIFGYGRVVLGEWPQTGIVKASIAEIEAAGGVKIDDYGPAGSDWTCVRFRIHGRRIRLIFEDFDEVSLWGPRNLILDLAQNVSKRMSASNSQATA
jgi:hypothetical protein